MSSVFESSTTNSYFYATFTTSEYTISASAVCVFYMNDIVDSFNGDYSARRGSIKAFHVPNPRPSSCPSNPTNEHLLFSRKNVLMKNEVASEAFIIESGVENSLIKIDVDFHVRNAYDELFNILFISTDKGQLMKFVVPINKTTFRHLSEEINNFYKEKYNIVEQPQQQQQQQDERKHQKKKYVIDNLKFVKSTTTTTKARINEDKYLVLMMNSNKILKLSKPVINNCYLKKNMSSCDNRINPYCVWIFNYCKFYDAFDNDLNSLIIMSNSNKNSSLLMNSTSIESPSRIINDIYDFTTVSYNNNNNGYKTMMNEGYQNVYLISFFFIMSIFVSFLFGMLLTLRLIGKNNEKQMSFVGFILSHERNVQIAARLRDVQGSVIRVGSGMKRFSYDVYNRIRHARLFKKKIDSDSNFNSPSDNNSNNNNEHEKQIVLSCSSICSDNSEQTDPRYVYVLNLVDTNLNVVKNNEKLVQDCDRISPNNENYSYLSNLDNGNTSDRTAGSTSNEDLYLN